MKFTLSWLKAHLDTGADVDTISEKLTALGLEVEEVIDRSKGLEALQGRLCGLGRKAPRRRQAARLHGRYRLRNGPGRLRRAQCPHRHEGRLRARRHDHPGNRGRAEEGRHPGRRVRTACSAPSGRWACRTSTTASSICPRTRPSASPFASVLGLDDPLIDISLTPDRADCAGVRGVARDLSAAGLGPLKPLDTTPVPGAVHQPGHRHASTSRKTRLRPVRCSSAG